MSKQQEYLPTDEWIEKYAPSLNDNLRSNLSEHDMPEENIEGCLRCCRLFIKDAFREKIKRGAEVKIASLTAALATAEEALKKILDYTCSKSCRDCGCSHSKEYIAEEALAKIEKARGKV